MTLSTCHEACSPRRHQSRASNCCTQGHQLMWCHACFRCMRCEQHKSVPQLHTPLCDTTSPCVVYCAQRHTLKGVQIPASLYVIRTQLKCQCKPKVRGAHRTPASRAAN